MSTKSLVAMAAVLILVAGAIGVTTWYASGRTQTRLVVLGIDGLDARVLKKLIERGDLPTFARLYREGASGTVRNADLGLPAVSPKIWTTYLTGRAGEEHGILGFVTKEDNKRRLYRSLDRRVPAAWEILSQAGRSVGVVNWWYSYPPEPVQGFIVTDHYFEQEVQGLVEITWAGAPQLDGLPFYPKSLEKVLNVPRQKKTAAGRLCS